MEESNQGPRCDMIKDCDAPVTHLDNKGFTYCERHGLQRRGHRPCRKLRPSELKKLERGERIARY